MNVSGVHGTYIDFPKQIRDLSLGDENLGVRVQIHLIPI